jgi:hydrogenase maturation protein HypF
MSKFPAAHSPSRRLAITVRGVVQGVGFRPFVYNTARALALGGWVLNDADMVRIEVEGPQKSLDAFLDALRRRPPPQARVEAVEEREIPAAAVGGREAGPAFVIRSSESRASPRPTIPADLATCDACLAEIFDPAQRRYRYPFTNCTHCGPRWSIIERLPYDRPRTAMAGFPMCPECRAEYENPADRRFHAQPIACPRCGPRLQLLDAKGQEVAVGEAAMTAAIEALLAGQIVAIKGLGGFQLLVDATNAEAVARLRRRKHRPDRPFAVMLSTLDQARSYCRVSDEEARWLVSATSPIVLLRRSGQCEAASESAGQWPVASGHSNPQSLIPNPSVVPGVAPGNPYLGVMLPYTPLHHLLMAALGRPIVCTSGNLSDEPMAVTIDDARRRLGSIADLLLTHDRPIVRPVDDSIVRVGPDGAQVLRRARGFAPRPIRVSRPSGPTPTILAVGGHLKNTVALLLGGRANDECGMMNDESKPAIHPSSFILHPSSSPFRPASPTPRPQSARSNPQSLIPNPSSPPNVVLSAHVGDLDSVLSVEVFRRAIDDLVGFFEATPDAVACDLHPDYASTRHAEQLAARWDVPLVRVQHHHAHVAACMAERGLGGPVLGFSWDGTGYGPDGTVWGGEVLFCEGSQFRRVAHLRTFPLPGGDQAMHEPRRSALGLLFELFGRGAAKHVAGWFRPAELEGLLSMLEGKVHSPRTSSIGRLFDAVAALCGLPPVISFEGQAAMSLEYLADEAVAEAYPIAISNCGAGVSPALSSQDDCSTTIDWAPLIEGILADRAAGVPASRISARFHNALAAAAVAVAKAVEASHGRLPIVLTGGCFQNALLTARARAGLSAAGCSVYTHKQVPPGDGGIALGQAFVALEQLQASCHVSGNPR